MGCTYNTRLSYVLCVYAFKRIFRLLGKRFFCAYWQNLSEVCAHHIPADARWWWCWMVMHTPWSRFLRDALQQVVFILRRDSTVVHKQTVQSGWMHLEQWWRCGSWRLPSRSELAYARCVLSIHFVWKGHDAPARRSDASSCMFRKHYKRRADIHFFTGHKMLSIKRIKYRVQVCLYFSN